MITFSVYTFATTVTLANNIKLENVSKMLGHTTTRMTEHYARVLNESLASDMDKISGLLPQWSRYIKMSSTYFLKQVELFTTY